MKSILFGAFIEYLSLDHGGARWRTTTALVLSNALVIVGAIVFQWSFGAVVFLYWAENIIIGALQVAKMTVRAARAKEWGSLAFFAPFFTFHFGMFTFVQGIFMALLATATDASLMDDVEHALRPSVWSVSSFLEGLWPPLAIAASSHVYSFWKHTVRGTSHKSVSDLMSEPYGRIAVMQITVIGGFWLLATFTNRGIGPLLLMMVAKTVVDFRAHAEQHAGR